MDKPILAIFDSEERYAYGFMEFISNKSNLPFQVHVFTEPERFFAYSKQEEIECLLISENVYQREVEALNIPHIIILSESSDCLNKSKLSESIHRSGDVCRRPFPLHWDRFFQKKQKYYT